MTNPSVQIACLVMAVLGVQFVITMMMATVLSRVGPHLSIARWLLCSRWVMAYCRLLSPSG